VRKATIISIVLLAGVAGYFVGYYARNVAAPPGKIHTVPGIELEMLRVDPGTFMMGSSDEEAEYRLRDRSRVDVLTDKHAIEVDWLDKWHQGIGQALHYSYLSGKDPVLAIGIKEEDYSKDKLEMAKRVAKRNRIAVWVLRAISRKEPSHGKKWLRS